MVRINEAIDFSWRKITTYFKYKRNIKKFYKTLNEGSPSFGVLWNFAEFIQYAELIYSYDNNKNEYLFASRDYTPGQRGFKINTPELTIICKLWCDTEKIGIDIENKFGYKIKTNYTFIKEKWTIEPTGYDEMYLDRIIDIINAAMIWLTDYCINKKLHDHLNFQVIG